MANDGKITRAQERALAALLACPSVPEAAQKAKVAERSLYRWLSRNEFQAAYRKERRKIVNHAVATIQAAMTEAVSTLQIVMRDTKASASPRVAAARVILDFGLKAVEIEDLAKRVAALEEQIDERAQDET
jgi:hypothetical protein